MNQHILPHYEDALNQAFIQVLSLGQKILLDLGLAHVALKERDKTKANAVIANENTLSADASRCRELCETILAQFHPMACDLRLVIALSRCTDKLNDSLYELISFTKRAKEIINAEEFIDCSLLDPVISLALEQLGNALSALNNKDSTYALTVRKQDKELDRKHRESMERIIQNTVAKVAPATYNMNLLFMTRALERIGDNAKSICASVVFMNEALDIRHGNKETSSDS